MRASATVVPKKKTSGLFEVSGSTKVVTTLNRWFANRIERELRSLTLEKDKSAAHCSD